MKDKVTMNDVKEYVELMLTYAKRATSADSVMNFRAQAYSVIMFTQNYLPYDELASYWEGGESGGMWARFNDIAREKNR